MNSETPDVTELRRRIARVEQSFEQLCATVMTIVAIGTAIALLIAIVVPFSVDDDAADPDNDSIASLAFGGVAGNDGELDSVEAVFLVAFLTLLVVIVAAMVSLAWIGSRTVTDRGARAVFVIAWLLLAGTCGAWIVAGMHEAAEADSAVGPAVYWLSAATLVYLLVTCLPGARTLWMRR